MVIMIVMMRRRVVAVMVVVAALLFSGLHTVFVGGQQLYRIRVSLQEHGQENPQEIVPLLLGTVSFLPEIYQY